MVDIFPILVVSKRPFGDIQCPDGFLDLARVMVKVHQSVYLSAIFRIRIFFLTRDLTHYAAGEFLLISHSPSFLFDL